MSGVKITLNKDIVKGRLLACSEKGTFIITNEFLKDANYYAKKDSGDLIESSIKASRPEKGIVAWDTPYAKRQYYTGSPSKDSNPNASLMWAHKAMVEHNKKYIRMLEKIIIQEV